MVKSKSNNTRAKIVKQKDNKNKSKDVSGKTIRKRKSEIKSSSNISTTKKNKKMNNVKQLPNKSKVHISKDINLDVNEDSDSFISEIFNNKSLELEFTKFNTLKDCLFYNKNYTYNFSNINSLTDQDKIKLDTIHYWFGLENKNIIKDDGKYKLL